MTIAPKIQNHRRLFPLKEIETRLALSFYPLRQWIAGLLEIVRIIKLSTRLSQDIKQMKTDISKEDMVTSISVSTLLNTIILT